MPTPTFRDAIESIARTRSSQATVFADFCRMAACAVSVLAREDEYLKIAANYSRDELSEFSQSLALLVQEMESKPFTDVLGPFYLEVAAHSSKQARGEFYTPPELSKLIATMTVDVEGVKASGKPITVSDPACGSGGMILALAELFAPDSVDMLRVTCQDINPVAADMCYLNTTLWGIPCNVLLGNSLGITVSGAWKNPHWRRVGEDERRMLMEVRSLITTPAPVASPLKPAIPDEKQVIREVNGQFEFDLTSLKEESRSR